MLPENQENIKKQGTFLKHKALLSGMAQKEWIQILINLTQSLESNSPELNPSYDVWEEIYGTWLDKHREIN